VKRSDIVRKKKRRLKSKRSLYIEKYIEHALVTPVCKVVYEVVYRCDRGLNGTKRMWRTPRRKLIMAFKLVADLCEDFPTGVSLARRLTTLVKEIVFLDFCVCVFLCMYVCLRPFPIVSFSVRDYHKKDILRRRTMQ